MILKLVMVAAIFYIGYRFLMSRHRCVCDQCNPKVKMVNMKDIENKTYNPLETKDDTSVSDDTMNLVNKLNHPDEEK